VVQGSDPVTDTVLRCGRGQLVANVLQVKPAVALRESCALGRMLADLSLVAIDVVVEVDQVRYCPAIVHG
jgi:hypothetical protein